MMSAAIGRAHKAKQPAAEMLRALNRLIVGAASDPLSSSFWPSSARPPTVSPKGA